MDNLIPVINRLQDVLTSVGINTGIDLPQIAVVGAQSVGKSSVLESLVGRDFLPRGTGIITRRPLILQLRNITQNKPSAAAAAASGGASGGASASSPSTTSGNPTTTTNSPPQEWGEFGHAPGHRFEDFDAIRKEIERETERVTGRNKMISAQPITLKIYSPYVIDLTLVDLPGMTKVPVGDQPSDIELQVRRLVLQYITKPSCIVLAITAANTDLANSDALKIAREVDPDGARTIGVLTKCDLMDDGTDALDMLHGKIYPLRRGYVAVVCRSQKDIAGKKNIRDALREEEKFFRSHAAYRHIAHKCGTHYLANMLNQIFMHHIRDTLPELKARIQTLLHENEEELAAYGDSMLEGTGNPGALLLHFFSKFARSFQEAIDGQLATQHLADQLQGGARINFIFHDWFVKTLNEFDPLSGLTDLEIRTSIRNATGPKAALFVPEGAFEILVKKQISKLEQPALRCVDQVYEELQKMVEMCESPEMTRYTNLRDRLVEVVRGVLRKCLQPTNQMISNLIQIELSYINTNHPDFVGGNRAIHSISLNLNRHMATSTPPTSRPPTQPTQQQNTQQQPQQRLTHTHPHANPHPHQHGGMPVGWNHPQSAYMREQQQQQQHQQQGSRHRSASSDSKRDDKQKESGGGAGGGAGGGHQANGPVAATPTSAHSQQHQHQQQQVTNPAFAQAAESQLPTNTGFFTFLRGSNRPSPPATPNTNPNPTSNVPPLPHTASNPPSHTVSTNDVVPAGTTQAGAPGGVYDGYYAQTKGNLNPMALPSGADSVSSYPSYADNPSQQQPPYPPPSSHLTTYYHGILQNAVPPHQHAQVGQDRADIRLPAVPPIVRAGDVASERERVEADLIKSLIASYFCIVRKNISDAVPKAIMYFMVNTAKEVLQRELVAQLYKDELFPELLKEADDIAERRQHCMDVLKTLRNALEIVGQIRDSNLQQEIAPST
ncbi:unnamed protein product [Vitrella brassicaformis CCMP3155]|uniref:Dynamin GTPase n=3 Tax=Vitrella brassicaformis TaxID=1169539 RepID=A0A0G4EBI2_VITBC|nr:unnamed protein product [Vitrella brassicaformis CCMP3155]|eukprot:CEL93330.1 unnamed protein product [Vitrella brassicaformis CCMP3155]